MFPPLRENCLLPHVENRLEASDHSGFLHARNFLVIFWLYYVIFNFCYIAKKFSVNGVYKEDRVEKAEESLGEHVARMASFSWGLGLTTFVPCDRRSGASIVPRFRNQQAVFPLDFDLIFGK